MIMPKECEKCLKGINERHLKDLEFERKKATELERKRIIELIDSCTTYWNFGACHNHIDKEKLKDKINKSKGVGEE